MRHQSHPRETSPTALCAEGSEPRVVVLGKNQSYLFAAALLSVTEIKLNLVSCQISLTHVPSASDKFVFHTQCQQSPLLLSRGSLLCLVGLLQISAGPAWTGIGTPPFWCRTAFKVLWSNCSRLGFCCESSMIELCQVLEMWFLQ